MKTKRLLTIAILAAASAGMSLPAAGIGDVFKEFSHRPGVEYVKIPRMLAMLGTKVCEIKGVPIPGKVTGVRVMSLDGCHDTVKADLARRVKELSSASELLLRATDDGELTQIWMDADGDTMRRLFIMSGNDLVEVSGKFSRKKIEELIAREMAD